MVGYRENCCRRLAGCVSGDRRIEERWFCFLFPMPCMGRAAMGEGFQSVTVRELSKGMFPGSVLYPKKTCLWRSNADSTFFKKSFQKSVTVVRSLFLSAFVDFCTRFALRGCTKPQSYQDAIAAKDYGVGERMDLTATAEAALQT